MTRRPLDFDQEEETRKVETSKWLEHHFGSDSRSSNNSIIDEEEEKPANPKTSFFNVTIKSQPSRGESSTPQKYVTTVNSSPRVYSPIEPERDRNNHSEYYKGISQWSERRPSDQYVTHTPSPTYQELRSTEKIQRSTVKTDYKRASPIPDYRLDDRISPSPVEYIRASPVYKDIRASPVPNYKETRTTSSIPGYKEISASPPPAYIENRSSPNTGYRESPIYKEIHVSPISGLKETRNSSISGYGKEARSYSRESCTSPPHRDVTPTPPQRKRVTERRQQVEERSRYSSRNGTRSKPVEEPPPDYSPPNATTPEKKMQKTRFAPDPPKVKSGNIIGESV